jgi:hypothetical protein
VKLVVFWNTVLGKIHDPETAEVKKGMDYIAYWGVFILCTSLNIIKVTKSRNL